jgi:restriction system protein
VGRTYARVWRRRHVAELRKDRKRKPRKTEDEEPAPAEEPGWKERLLDHLMAMRPDGFERLARRLLREADYDSVNVTGQSGDGGIDGLGVYRGRWRGERANACRHPAR